MIYALTHRKRKPGGDRLKPRDLVCQYLKTSRRSDCTVTDTRTRDQRRRIMQSVKQKNTKPEMVVRKVLHGGGYRYRLHSKHLPGKPDVVFPSRRMAIFVHGCFWHGHNCKFGRLPKSRLDYWGPKIGDNQARDQRNVEELTALGWSTLTVWECETPDVDALKTLLWTFLGESKKRRI